MNKNLCCHYFCYVV